MPTRLKENTPEAFFISRQIVECPVQGGQGTRHDGMLVFSTGGGVKALPSTRCLRVDVAHTTRCQNRGAFARHAPPLLLIAPAKHSSRPRPAAHNSAETDPAKTPRQAQPAAIRSDWRETDVALWLPGSHYLALRGHAEKEHGAPFTRKRGPQANKNDESKANKRHALNVEDEGFC